jgi:hypothetical protein
MRPKPRPPGEQGTQLVSQLLRPPILLVGGLNYFHRHIQISPGLLFGLFKGNVWLGEFAC